MIARNGEANYLSQTEMALTNSQNKEEIATILAEYTYGTEKVAEGKAIYDETVIIWKQNKIESDEQSQAYAIFSGLYEELEKTYSSLRKRAKIIFRKDEETLKQLSITGSKPKTYAKFVVACEKLYEELKSEEALLTKLAPMKVTKKTINDGIKLIGDVKDARYSYHKEKSENQQATIDKDNALTKLDDWMDDFFAVAKIALEDEPQFLEALGITVRY
jgi:hypothetical protein